MYTVMSSKFRDCSFFKAHTQPPSKALEWKESLQFSFCSTAAATPTCKSERVPRMQHQEQSGIPQQDEVSLGHLKDNLRFEINLDKLVCCDIWILTASYTLSASASDGCPALKSSSLSSEGLSN